VRLYHGTTSACLDRILSDGRFDPPSYFATLIADAREYAAMGGEWDLQRREEEYEAEHGFTPREEYGPDIWDMYRDLYPAGQHPVVVAIDIPMDLLSTGQPDSGAEGGVVFHVSLPSSLIADVVRIEWDEPQVDETIAVRP